MKLMPRLQKIIIPIVAVAVGLMVGLGVGQFQIKKEQKISQDKMKEANRKIAYLQKKMTEEKNETAVSLEQKCKADLDKMQDEKNALEGQLGKLKEKALNLESKIKESDDVSAKLKKELQEAVHKYAQAIQHNKDLDRERKKTVGEKENLQAAMKKTTRELGRCEENNAKLCIIADELVKSYRNKGIGATILEKEPLIQIKKVELEQLTQKYQEEIEHQKIRKK